MQVKFQSPIYTYIRIDRTQEVESIEPKQEVGEKHKDCEEGKEKRREEEEGTKDIDSTSDMDELSTDYTSEGSDEFQDCDGEEFEDWTSEADCGHQLMRSFPSHCIGRRIEIRHAE